MSIVYSSSYITNEDFFANNNNLISPHPSNEITEMNNVIYISQLENELHQKSYELVIKDLQKFFMYKKITKLIYNLVIKDIFIHGLQRINRKHGKCYMVYKSLVIEDQEHLGFL